jgi:SAM-dependent methyltransferase
MAEVEGAHWWYRTLHDLVGSTLERFHAAGDVRLLDAGCGTGGLIAALQARGYSHTFGFDISENGVEICKSKDYGHHPEEPAAALEAIRELTLRRLERVVMTVEARYDAAMRRHIMGEISSQGRSRILLWPME